MFCLFPLREPYTPPPPPADGLKSVTAISICYRHPIYLLCLLAIPTESLGYTVLMGVPPKVQPLFVSYTLRITRLHCTHGCGTQSAAYVC